MAFNYTLYRISGSGRGVENNLHAILDVEDMGSD